MKGLMKACSGGLAIWRGWRYRIVYVRECAGSSSVGRPQKRWIDTVKGCLKKRSLDVRQARSKWLGFVRGNAWGVA